jgi:hypothetical protein
VGLATNLFLLVRQEQRRGNKALLSRRMKVTENKKKSEVEFEIEIEELEAKIAPWGFSAGWPIDWNF